MNNLHVKKGDTVIVLSGNDKGKVGKVVEVSPKEGKVIVEKVNVQTKHVKARKQNDPSGIMEVEGAIYACKVRPYVKNDEPKAKTTEKAKTTKSKAKKETK
jgi:large subunit ribosomal protein L24